MIKFTETDRGFIRYMTNAYPPNPNGPKEVRLVQESSAIDLSTKDGLENPGSSFLWIGVDSIHLNREGVKEMVRLLQHWLDTGSLPTQ